MLPCGVEKYLINCVYLNISGTLKIHFTMLETTTNNKIVITAKHQGAVRFS